MRFHDGSTRVRVYNEASDVVQFTDENGSVMENTFDALGRKTQCDITKAAGVVGTDAQSFQYDGLTRQTQAMDTLGATDATVQMFYDSLSRVVEDSQTYTLGTQNVTTTAFASHPIGQLTFPNGRQIDNTYDLLYRRTDVSDTGGGTIAAWRFFGPSRVAELVMGNGLICTQMNNARTRSSIQEGQTEVGWQGQVTPPWGDQSSNRLGYDGAGRIVTKRYLTGALNPLTFGYLNTTPIVGFTAAFDRSSNKFFERHLHAESRSHLYEPFANGTPQGGYDSIDRLRQYQRGVLTSTGGKNNLGGGGIETPITLPNTDQSRTYDLDGLGNWRRTTFEPVGGSQTTEIRQHNALNQITKRDATPFSYDLNGNLLDDGTRLYTWDALNRLANVRRKSDGSLIGEYTYDATARRIQKIVSNGGLSGNIPNGTTHYLYTAWQCLEETDGFGSPLKQYVWGIYIDELLQQRLLTTINNHGAGDYFPLSDLLYRTTALTDAAANIIEAYDTDAYGNTLIFTAPGTAGNWWADDADQTDNATCDFIFTGQRYVPEADCYYYRARYFDPEFGRFASRDLRGYAKSLNLYGYSSTNPAIFVDPTGASDISPVWQPPEIPISKTWETRKGDWDMGSPDVKNCSFRLAGAAIPSDELSGAAPNTVVTISPLTGLQGMINTIVKYGCCRISIFGHQGGDIGNCGGMTIWPNGHGKGTPITVFPNATFQMQLRQAFRRIGCSECAIQTRSCSCPENEKRINTRQGIADATGCTYSGTVPDATGNFGYGFFKPGAGPYGTSCPGYSFIHPKSEATGCKGPMPLEVIQPKTPL